jgi:hypothetical protein
MWGHEIHWQRCGIGLRPLVLIDEENPRIRERRSGRKSPQFPEALTAPIRYGTPRLSDRDHTYLRVTFAILLHRGSTRAVVATDYASVDADCDNGTAFHGTRESRKSYGLAVQCVDAG